MRCRRNSGRSWNDDVSRSTWDPWVPYICIPLIPKIPSFVRTLLTRGGPRVEVGESITSRLIGSCSRDRPRHSSRECPRCLVVITITVPKTPISLRDYQTLGLQVPPLRLLNSREQIRKGRSDSGRFEDRLEPVRYMSQRRGHKLHEILNT